MKKILFLYLFWLFNITFAQNSNDQLFEIEYDKYFNIDEDKFYKYYSNTYDKDIVERNKHNFTNTEHYALICSSAESVFKKLAKINNSQNIKDNIKANGNEISFYSNGGLILYKNLNKHFALIPTNDKIMIQDSLYNFKWDLNYIDEKNILGFKTNKATTIGLEPDTTVTVWYTKEIPYNNGPDIYWGLPGLILQVDIIVNSNQGMASYINSYHYIAKTIKEIDSTKEFKKNMKKNEVLTRDEYEEKKFDIQKKQNEYNSQGVDTD